MTRWNRLLVLSQVLCCLIVAGGAAHAQVRDSDASLTSETLSAADVAVLEAAARSCVGERELSAMASGSCLVIVEHQSTTPTLQGLVKQIPEEQRSKDPALRDFRARNRQPLRMTKSFERGPLLIVSSALLDAMYAIDDQEKFNTRVQVRLNAWTPGYGADRSEAVVALATLKRVGNALKKVKTVYRLKREGTAWRVVNATEGG